jgi:adenylate kinase
LKEQRILLFFGPPGAGKGTLAQRCADELGWLQLSTGNLCRSHINSGTDIGKRIDLTIKSGKLIDDALMTEMVADSLSRYQESETIILDGYPRTLAQAYLFKELMSSLGRPYQVVSLKVDEETLMRRAKSRLVCSKSDCQAVYSSEPAQGVVSAVQICFRCNSPLKKRADDEEQVILERIRSYRSHEAALRSFFESEAVQVNEIYVDQPLDDVFSDFKKLLVIEREN